MDVNEAISDILEVFHNLALIDNQQQEALEQLRRQHEADRAQSVRSLNEAQEALQVAHRQELSEQLDRLASGISRTRSIHRRRQEELLTYLEETHIDVQGPRGPQRELATAIIAQQRRPPVAVLDVDDSDEELDQEGEERNEGAVQRQENENEPEPPEPVVLDPEFAGAIIEAQQRAAAVFVPVQHAPQPEPRRRAHQQQPPAQPQAPQPQPPAQPQEPQAIQDQTVRIGSYVRILNSCRLARQGLHYHVHGTVIRIGAVYYTVRVWNYAINRNEEFRRQRHNIRLAVRPQE